MCVCVCVCERERERERERENDCVCARARACDLLTRTARQTLQGNRTACTRRRSSCCRSSWPRQVSTGTKDGSAGESARSCGCARSGSKGQGASVLMTGWLVMSFLCQWQSLVIFGQPRECTHPALETLLQGVNRY